MKSPQLNNELTIVDYWFAEMIQTIYASLILYFILNAYFMTIKFINRERIYLEEIQYICPYIVV